MTKKIGVILLGILLFGCEELTDDITLTGRERLEGSWIVNEESQVFKSTATVHKVFISVDASTTNRVIIENFYGVDEGAISAIVSGRDISIPRQTFGDYSALSGDGTINTTFNEISWEYVVDIGGVIDTVLAVYEKE
ncbi:MAG: hypothetical protein GVY19_02125 [Bacteroidetes bacterium]|jgi:hypothetical protein|nr:hypothetical protein [Bacteroidota bacterium]